MLVRCARGMDQNVVMLRRGGEGARGGGRPRRDNGGSTIPCFAIEDGRRRRRRIPSDYHIILLQRNVKMALPFEMRNENDIELKEKDTRDSNVILHEKSAFPMFSSHSARNQFWGGAHPNIFFPSLFFSEPNDGKNIFPSLFLPLVFFPSVFCYTKRSVNLFGTDLGE